MLTRILSIIILMAISSYAFSVSNCYIEPNKKKIYRLDLTVPAVFCLEHYRDPSCTDFPKPSLFQLHGLWPNYTEGGYPQGSYSHTSEVLGASGPGKFCRLPEPEGLYASSTWQHFKPYMAGTEKCLERHEWIKHGTCTSMNPVTYFGWGLEKTVYISQHLAIAPDTLITRDQFNTMIKKHLPSLDGTLHLACKKNAVSGLYIIYDWGTAQPGAPLKTHSGNNSFGNCPNQFLFLSNPTAPAEQTTGRSKNLNRAFRHLWKF